MMPDRQRLFFALWPTPEQQVAWAAQAKAWLPENCGRLVAAENLHITLLFAGSVDGNQRQCLESAGDAVVGQPFELWLQPLGYWKKPQVLWWGANESPRSLLQLVNSLKQKTKQCDIQVDERPYQAHMTLARKVRRRPELAQPEKVKWSISDFVLARSVTKAEGVQYEVLRRWSLL